MKKSSVFVLAASPALAWNQPRFGYVPGNDFATGAHNATYDYVVVGGGTAGLAVAYRLAESGEHTVAIVEAGGYYEQDNGNMSVVPAYCPAYGAIDPESASLWPLVDWGFVTQAQKGLGGRRLHYARGKTLGGSSALNALIYNRGTAGSYQQWADLVDDDSWTFDNLLPHFARGITYTPADADLRAANASVPPPANPRAFNGSGPLQVSHPNFAQVFASYIAGAMAESGILEQQDFASGELLGRQFAPETISYPEEERSSSQSSYLDRALRSGRSNLKVYPHTLARKVLFDLDRGKTASAVEVERNSYGNPHVFRLNATKEIIISAGAFQSPQLLMVSGIGAREQLETHNISVVAERPGVGANMEDHLDFSPVWEINIENGVGATADPSLNGPLIEEYRANRTGPFTNPGVDYIGWEKLPELNRNNLSTEALADLARFPADWPEVEYEITAAALVANTDPSKRYATVIAVPVSSLSRGWVNITSDSTRDLPSVNPNHLSHPTDREVAVQAFMRARSFFETEAMKPIVIRETMPCGNVTSHSDILDYIMQTGYQNWHASCTCRMGRTDDPMAVVDSKARVIGVRGLRVVDASSFALLPPGHPQSTVYLMAEKIAADILESEEHQSL